MSAKAPEELDELLTPDALKGKPDPLEGTTAGLTPDYLRGGEDEEDELKPAKTETPETPVVVKEEKIRLSEWIKKQDDTPDLDGPDEIEKAFEKAYAERGADPDDLTPDNLK
jgi:hypothetical protein